MSGYLGGIRITSVEWASASAIAVRFLSAYTDKLYHLYAGRCRIGLLENPAGRTISGQLIVSGYPQHLTLVAVDPVDRQTDFGPRLPLRPYNRVKLQFSTSSWPDDAKFIDVTAGTAPGGAVDASNRIARLLYDLDREYEVITEPLGPSGTWKFEAAGRDDKRPDGNLGSPLALSQTILTHPPDVALDGSGNRLSVAIAGQQATVSFTP